MPNLSNDKTTLIPTRRADVSRLDTIMSAIGLAKQKKMHRVDAITYVLDAFENDLPKEVRRFLTPAIKPLGRQ